MTEVVVVDDDSALLRALERELRREGMSVRCTASVDEAITWIEQTPCDVLVTDLRMSDMDGLTLIHRAHEASPSTRTILMSGLASAKDYDAALELGAVRVLCKPFTNAALVEAVRQAAECHSGFRGSIHGLGLTDLLQMFHFGRRSLVLSVEPKRQGRIYLEHGAIVHAEHGELVGENALKKLLALPGGALRSEPFSEPAQRSISRDFQEVLLDSLRSIDEAADANMEPVMVYRSSTPASDEPVPVEAPKSSPLPHEAYVVEMVVSVDPALRPATAFATAPVAARFAAALTSLPHRSQTLLAYGLQLSTQKGQLLHGEPARAFTPESVAEVLSAATRVAGSRKGVLERMTPGCVMYAIWDLDADIGIVVADGYRVASDAALLRASIQTFARRFLDIEET